MLSVLKLLEVLITDLALGLWVECDLPDVRVIEVSTQGSITGCAKMLDRSLLGRGGHATLILVRFWNEGVCRDRSDQQ